MTKIFYILNHTACFILSLQQKISWTQHSDRCVTKIQDIFKILNHELQNEFFKLAVSFKSILLMLYFLKELLLLLFFKLTFKAAWIEKTIQYGNMVFSF